MTLKLFISHSSRIDDPTGNGPAQHDFSLLDECCKLIRKHYGKKIEVLVDKDIRCGDAWEKRLNMWLGECHAAVILCSRRAVECSNWVKKEVAVLTWRREWEHQREAAREAGGEPAFKLIPVLLDEIKPEDLQCGFFGTLKVTDTQCTRDAKGAADVLAAVRKALGEPAKLCAIRPTPLDALAEAVRQIIAEAVSADTLERVLQAIEPTATPPRAAPGNRVEIYSTEIARHLLRNGANAMQSFIQILGAMRPRPTREKAEELLKSIRALWVHSGAAAMLPAARHHPELVALNGDLVLRQDADGACCYTLDRYKERAWADADPIKVITISNLNDIAAVRDEIRTRYRPARAGASAPTTKVDQWIKESPRAILVLLKTDLDELPDQHICPELIQLKHDYKNLIFVISSGSRLPEQVPNGVRLVQPELDPDTEWDRWHDEQKCWETIDQKYGAKL